jgi:hypothetical protein
MKLRAVYFERNVPIGTGDRIDELHLAGDPYNAHAGWTSLVRNEDASITATKGARTITLDGYAYTYELATSDSAGEAWVLPPRPASSAESGAAVDQGLTGAAGSTPARLAKGKRR